MLGALKIIKSSQLTLNMHSQPLHILSKKSEIVAMMAVLMLMRFGRSIPLNKHALFRLYVHMFLYCLSQKIEKNLGKPYFGIFKFIPQIPTLFSRDVHQNFRHIPI